MEAQPIHDRWLAAARIAALVALCTALLVVLAVVGLVGAPASASGSVRTANKAATLRTSDPPCPQFGVNLSGGEFGNVPGTYGVDYIYPGINDAYGTNEWE